MLIALGEVVVEEGIEKIGHRAPWPSSSRAFVASIAGVNGLVM
jgi:hypothetical protein